METHSETIRRFTAAWQRGDDDAINRITIEVHERGNDAELVALTKAMANTPHGGRK